MIDLYTWPTPNGHKVHIMLEETGLPYTVHPIDIQAGDQFKPDFLKISPNNKMPAIVDQDGPGGKPMSMFESGAILFYLASKTGKFLPADVRDRWTVMQWVMFQMGHIGPMLGQAHHFLGYAPEKIEYAMNRYRNEANRLYGVLDRRLREVPYVAGKEYTIADMAIMPWLRSYERQGVNMDEYPNVRRWFDKINERPAVKRGLQVLADRRRTTPLTPEQREVMFGAKQYERRWEETAMAALSGKVAWITGAGSGIGQAGAVELAKAGATVVISGRRAEALEDTRALVAAAGGEVHKLPLDVADKKQVAHAAKELLERHRRCDILVNSAGLNVPKRFYKDLVPEDWDKVISINLNGALYCVTAVLPAMRTQGSGLVINISSWLGRWVGYLGGPAYGASKHALATITHHLNLEEGHHGIRGTVIYPGEVATPILKTRPVPPAQEDLARMLKQEDLGRTIRFVAEMPPHVCLNEIVITPTWNRLYLGGKELRLAPETD